MKFFKFMAGSTGRILRIIAGAALIAIGFAFKSPIGFAMVFVGALPLLSGIFDVCIFAPLFRMPFTGKKIRSNQPS